MNSHPYLQDFIKECTESIPKTSGEKFIGWEGLVYVLVTEGLKILLPELKEWVKLGVNFIVMKRLEIKKRLESYAMKKELDFPAAEKAATAVANNITENNIDKLIQALEGKKATYSKR